MLPIRNHDHGHEEHTASSSNSSPLAHFEDMITRRQRWVQLLQHKHYEPLITEILEDELPKYTNSRVINPANRISLLRECVLILASTPHTLLAAMQGKLLSSTRVDANLQTENKRIYEHADIQPSIYIHFLTDKHGIAPTPAQYLLVRACICEYIRTTSASAFAFAIDNISQPPVTREISLSGYRKYLQTRGSQSLIRVGALTRFTAGILALCNSIPSDQHTTPLPFPPAECGYSRRSLRRIVDHQARRSSNYIMNLVEDICSHLYNTRHLPQRFQMHPFIVALLFRPTQASIAEIFCSGLLQVWIDGGMGFNGTPAGRSVESAGRVRAHSWEWYERLTRTSSGLVTEMERVKTRAEEWRNAVDWEVETVATEEREVVESNDILEKTDEEADSEEEE